ncbi:hypothetical protein Tco_1064492 [Tanacetum coccineum]
MWLRYNQCVKRKGRLLLFAVQRLLVRAVLNAEVRGKPIPTLPFVTSSVSATPERENENPADSVTGANIAEAEVDSIVRSSTLIIATVVTATVDAAETAKETPVRPYLFSASSSSAGGTDPTLGGFSDVSGSDFLIGAFTEFNVGVARQISLSAEVRMHAEYNIKEKRKLRAVVEEKDILLKAKGEEVDILKAQLLVKEAEAAEAIFLRAETSKFEAVEKSLRDEVEFLKERNITLEREKSVLDVKVSDLVATFEGFTQKKEQFEEFQDVQMRMVSDKLAKLEVDLSEMTLHVKEKFYPHLLTTIARRRWLLTHGLKLFLTKCLNSSEYLSALGAAISRAIEKV